MVFWGQMPKGEKPGYNSLGPGARGNLDILRSWSMEYDIYRCHMGCTVRPVQQIAVFWHAKVTIYDILGPDAQGGETRIQQSWASRAKKSRYLEVLEHGV